MKQRTFLAYLLHLAIVWQLLMGTTLADDDDDDDDDNDDGYDQDHDDGYDDDDNYLSYDTSLRAPVAVQAAAPGTFSNRDGSFQLQWAADAKSKMVQFNITAKTKGYFALGFNSKGSFHAGGDVFAMTVSGATNFLAVTGKSTKGQSQPVKVRGANPYIVDAVSFDSNSGTMTASIRRPFAPKGLTKLANANQNAFWALGNSKISSKLTYRYHASKGSFKKNFLL